LSKSGSGAEHWDHVAREWVQKGYSNELLAEHKKKTYLDLIARWADVSNARNILKTDLFQEASGPDQFLFDLGQVNSNVIGIDVSQEIVSRAKTRAKAYSVDASKYLRCDVRHLPFRDNSISLIISDSTLDHFPGEADIVTALQELGRALRPGGVLILTLDNSSNPTYPPYIVFRLWMRLGLSPYFIGKTLSLKRLRRNLDEIGFDVAESTTIFHYPHPDGLVRLLERSLRKLSRGKLDNTIRKALALLDKLEGKRTKYLTGRYIAVKAVKRQAKCLH